MQQNIFLIRDKKFFTPSQDFSILAGITWHAVIEIAKNLGNCVQECRSPREILYPADEIFFPVTAAEIVPVRSIDKRDVGKTFPGSVTREIKSQFFGLFTGQTRDQRGWLEAGSRQQPKLEMAL